MATVNYKERQ